MTHAAPSIELRTGVFWRVFLGIPQNTLEGSPGRKRCPKRCDGASWGITFAAGGGETLLAITGGGETLLAIAVGFVN